MTNDNPYDPCSHEALQRDAIARVAHEHRRKYDAGLIAPPLSLERSGRVIVVIVLTAAISFFGAFYVIGKAAADACEQRQALATTLITIIKRSEPRLRDFYLHGTITKQQLERSLADNRTSIRELTFTC